MAVLSVFLQKKGLGPLGVKYPEQELYWRQLLNHIK